MNNNDGGRDGVLAEVWETMKSLFDNPSLKIKRSLWMNCNSQVYNYCLRGGNVHQLHIKLKDFFGNHLNGILKLWDTSNDDAEKIVSFYTEQWENFKSSSKHLNSVFKYFNRLAQNYSWALFREDERECYNLAKLMWKQLIFESKREQLTNSILTLIDCQRKGVKMVDYRLITSVLELYYEDDKSNLETYQQHFEQQFLQGTKLYYNNDSSIVLETREIIDYGENVTFLESTIESRFTDVPSINWGKCFQAERELIIQCFHKSTLTKVMDYFEDILIQTNCDKLCNEFLRLICDEKANYIQYIGTVYKVMARLDEPIEKMMELFIIYVQTQCKKALEEFEKFMWNNPAVAKILDIHTKCSKVVLEAFQKDCRCLENLDSICLRAIREGTANKCPQSQSSQRFGELLALYCDSLLRKSKRNHLAKAEIGQALENSMRLFKTMDAEDVSSFKKMYKDKFFDRLVSRKMASNSAEMALLKKLKAIGEYWYSYELKKMYQRTMISKKVSQEFSIQLERTNFTLALNFQVHYCIPDAWKSEEFETLTLPPELKHGVTKFSDFYKEKHGIRKLIWQHHLSSGVIVSKCYKKNYEFQASSFQMVVLLMYNSNDSYGMQELTDKTGLPMRTLVRVVECLINEKLLVSSDPMGKAAAETVVSFRKKCANKNRRVTIQMNHSLSLSPLE